PFWNWKTIVGFGAAGAYLAYSEWIFDAYARATEVDPSGLLPIQLEYRLKTLPVYQQLANTSAGDDWVMMKSYENLDRNALDNSAASGAYVRLGNTAAAAVKSEAAYAAQHLTSHTLAQPGGIAVPPVIFHNRSTNDTVTIVHMGYRLCGYPFIVHGGMLATLLNETFKRNASLRHDAAGFLKDDYKVESLAISYRRPAFADQFFVLRTEQVPAPGPDRPAVYKSTIEAENGAVLVEAHATLRHTGRASHRHSQEQASRWALF
ncbi:hypothetical protein METBIDRAFT_19233, partial [Metschnikowia bicuspidata var. bicuspidata NRRL YB-4993]